MLTRRRIACAAAIAAWQIAEPAMTAAQGSQDTLASFAYTHATVIDGTGAPPRRNQTIVINHGIITGYFDDDTRAFAPGLVNVRDLRGKFIIPGLIDSHVHVATDPSGQDANAAATLRRALLGGLTSVRDMAGDAIVLKELAASAARADAESPRLFYASLMAGPTFFNDPRTKASAHGGTPGDLPWMKAITPTTDVKIAVRDAKATGATAIKIYADLPADLVANIATEAHRQGMKVWSHSTVFPATALDAVDAGVDVISHAIYLYWAAIPNPPMHYADRDPPRSAYDSVPPDGPVMQDLFTRMKAQNTVFDATLSILRLC